MKISYCPFCGDCDSDRQVVNEVGRHYRVYCLACGADGPIGESEDSAIKPGTTDPIHMTTVT